MQALNGTAKGCSTLKGLKVQGMLLNQWVKKFQPMVSTVFRTLQPLIKLSCRLHLRDFYISVSSILNHVDFLALVPNLYLAILWHADTCSL